MDELGALLHHRQIGGEVGVKYIVKAQTVQRGRELPGHKAAGGAAKLLLNSHPDGGGALDKTDRLRILQRRLDLGQLALEMGGKQRLQHVLRNVALPSYGGIAAHVKGGGNIGFALLNTLAAHDAPLEIDGLGLPGQALDGVSGADLCTFPAADAQSLVDCDVCHGHIPSS